MKWTRNKPDKPGKYFYRDHKESSTGIISQLQILYINANRIVLHSRNSNQTHDGSIEDYTGQWAGPISESSEDSEPEIRPA